MMPRMRRGVHVFSWAGIIAVGGGAAAGAWLRWGLSIALNPVFPTLPLGTLAANLIGGLLMGVAMELVTRHTLLSPEASLLVTTGFLGGLTTFSTFSGEITTLILRREWLWSVVGVGAHVVGSIAMTLAGLVAARALFQWRWA
ncbi:MAG TPA: fluoride efflux transporter CrcB [Casimicrobiaceae bacterium]|jgi:CrcB protein